MVHNQLHYDGKRLDLDEDNDDGDDDNYYKRLCIGISFLIIDFQSRQELTSVRLILFIGFLARIE